MYELLCSDAIQMQSDDIKMRNLELTNQVHELKEEIRLNKEHAIHELNHERQMRNEVEREMEKYKSRYEHMLTIMRKLDKGKELEMDSSYSI